MIAVTSEKRLPIQTTPGHHALNVIKKNVMVPPLSSMINSVVTENSVDFKGAIEGDQNLLVNSQICVSRGIPESCVGKAKGIAEKLQP